MIGRLVALVPCRKGSERVIKQLANVPELDKISISTNDPVVMDFSRDFSATVDSRVEVVERPDELGSSSTPMSSFIRYSATLEDSGDMMMTHVTHPFITSEVFSGLIKQWKVAQ